MEFRHARGGFVFLTDSHGEECLYEDLDAASKSAMAVGFQQVRIEDWGEKACAQRLYNSASVSTSHTRCGVAEIST